jgi:hypothetical protein
MTAAGLQKPPPEAREASPYQAPALAGLRLVLLHLVSRRVPAAVAALAVCAAALRAALLWHWSLGSGPGAQELPVLIECGAAGLIAVSTYNPFGEPERATGRWLPYLRLGTAVGLTAVAFAALCAGSAAEPLPGGILGILRNVSGATGIGLLLTAVAGASLAWVGPMAYMVVSVFGIAGGWTTPWLWPARPTHDRGAAICAALVFAAGLAVTAARGPRDTERE